jgi:NAD(P)-dependent dehydrogenase (short-subunit alcohol dehydrogenase family)
VILAESPPYLRIGTAFFSYCDRERGQVNALADCPRAAYKACTKSRERPVPKGFEGKVVVVTGGSRGIGKAIATAFAREGAQVVLAAAIADNLAAAAKAMTGGPAPMTVAGDLRTLAGCEQLFKAVNDKFKRCDILVNNAGATRGGNFFDLPDEAFVDGFALKFCCRAFVAAVLATAQGIAWKHHQHHRGGGQNARARFPDRRFGERRLCEFREGLPSAIAMTSTSTLFTPAWSRPTASSRRSSSSPQGEQHDAGRGTQK